MDLDSVRADLHEFDVYQSIRVDILHPRVPNDLEDAFTKSVTALKCSEGMGKWGKENTAPVIQRE